MNLRMSEIEEARRLLWGGNHQSRQAASGREPPLTGIRYHPSVRQLGF